MSFRRRTAFGGNIVYEVDAESDLATIPNPKASEEAFALAEGSLWFHDGTNWVAVSGGSGVTDHGALTGLADDDHPQYTTDAEATTIADTEAAAAVATHEAAPDPHTGYATDTDLSNHEAAADPHAGYLKESDFQGVDFLVGTATGLTANEITVGTSPGGELGGTWASPTVDATHSGSAHIALGSTEPGMVSTTSSGTAGSGATASKVDHAHDLGFDDATSDPVAVNTSAADGTEGSAARKDHRHAHEAAHINHDTTWAAKGDLIVGTANDTAQVLGVGTDTHVLTADSTQATGVKWAAAGSGSVASDTIWDAKGDLAAGTGADTAAKVTVGANDTILMADSAQSTGLKWVAAATPSTQAMGDSAAEGTADTYTRGDHKHAMPSLGFGLTSNSTPAVSLTTSEAFVTADTACGNGTYADATGGSVTLAAGTWLLLATASLSQDGTNLGFGFVVAIRDGSNNLVCEAGGRSAAGGSGVKSWGTVALSAVVTPGSSTTYKLSGMYFTNAASFSDGAGTGASQADSNSDKGTGIRAIRVA